MKRSDDLMDIVLCQLAEILPDLVPTRIERQSSFSDIGIDSVKLLELVGALEIHLNVQLPDEGIAGLRTIGELLDLLDRYARSTRRHDATRRGRARVR